MINIQRTKFERKSIVSFISEELKPRYGMNGNFSSLPRPDSLQDYVSVFDAVIASKNNTGTT